MRNIIDIGKDDYRVMSVKKYHTPSLGRVVIAGSLLVMLLSWMALLIYALHQFSMLLVLLAIVAVPAIFFGWMCIIYKFDK